MHILKDTYKYLRETHEQSSDMFVTLISAADYIFFRKSVESYSP